MNESLIDWVKGTFGVAGLILIIVGVALYRMSKDLASLNTRVSYQLNRDLLGRRISAYRSLWACMSELAIHSSLHFDATETSDLEEALSRWYFRRAGGLMLTHAARSYYFGLQNALRAAAKHSGWTCENRPSELREQFIVLLRDWARDDDKAQRCLKKFENGEPERMDPKDWTSTCTLISGKLEALAASGDPNAGAVIYCALQQISSALRSKMTQEVRSRLDVMLPG